MKQKIEKALQELKEETFYGVGRFKERNSWDCIIFGRRKSRKSDGNTLSKRWFVAIVKEDEIPEGMEEEVIEVMRKAGLKRADTDIQYDYVDKSGECVVEICTMEFYKSEKGCKA